MLIGIIAPTTADATEARWRCENRAYFICGLENVENCALNDPILYGADDDWSWLLSYARLEDTTLLVKCEAPTPQVRLDARNRSVSVPIE